MNNLGCYYKKYAFECFQYYHLLTFSYRINKPNVALNYLKLALKNEISGN